MEVNMPEGEGVISSKASFTHVRAIIDGEHRDLFFHGDWRRQRQSSGTEEHRAELQEDEEHVLATARKTKCICYSFEICFGSVVSVCIKF